MLIILLCFPGETLFFIQLRAQLMIFFSFLLHFITGKSEFGALNNNCMVFVKLKNFLHAQISSV